MNAGRPDGISIYLEFFAPSPILVAADNQISRDKEYFFPIIVYERLCRVGARLEFQQARAVPALSLFVEFASNDFLPDAFRVSGRRMLSGRHVHRMEFFVSLVENHNSPPLSSSGNGSIWWRCRIVQPSSGCSTWSQLPTIKSGCTWGPAAKQGGIRCSPGLRTHFDLATRVLADLLAV